VQTATWQQWHFAHPNASDHFGPAPPRHTASATAHAVPPHLRRAGKLPDAETKPMHSSRPESRTAKTNEKGSHPADRRGF